MLRLNRLTLQRMHVWQQVLFDFVPGITLVTGNNGSGKTLLFRSLGLILRSQIIKRGSSLSRVPKAGEIGLDLTAVDGTEVSARLTTNKLDMVRGGENQGSTGKAAARLNLNDVLSIPAELFDSTILVTGKGEHPLVDVRSTPGSRLEWVSAVLNLTGLYDHVAVSVERELKTARPAAERLAVVREELQSIEWPPTMAGDPLLLQQQVERLRAVQARLQWAAVHIHTVREAQDLYEPTLREQQVELKSELIELRTELVAAERWRTEQTRRSQLERLLEERASLQHSLPPEQLPALRALLQQARVLQTGWQQQSGAWAAEARERQALQQAQQLLQTAPDQLAARLEQQRADWTTANRLIDTLRQLQGHTQGSCPVCATPLAAEQQRNICAVQEQRKQRAGEQLSRLERFERAQQTCERLATLNVVEPVAPQVADLIEGWQRWLNQSERAAGLDQRIADFGDLDATAVAQNDPATLRQQIETTEGRLRSCEQQLDVLARATQSWQQLSEAFGTVDPAQWEQANLDCTSQLETAIHTLATMQAVQSQQTEAERRSARLEQSCQELEALTAHLPELLEMREALGKRGLRLKDIRDLMEGFVAEFNSLVPLLWDEQFELEIVVNDTGLEIRCTRNETQEDLHSLSGAEDKVWKLTTALALIRILPDRLRCNCIILDEVEANLDGRVHERFVSRYLPELRKNVEVVVLVSPHDFTDVPLARVASWQVVKTRTRSELVRTG